MRARHRLSKLLLRQGIVYSGGQAWTGPHDAWLRQQRFDSAATADGVRVRLRHGAGRHRAPRPPGRGDRRAWPATASSRRWCAGWRCLRGVSTLTAFALAVEIGDWQRFTGNSIGSFVGLVPTEHSSGASRVQGSITKTGNTHARRLLVEAAWHHRARYRARQDHARPVGTRPAGRTSSRRRRQPAPARNAGSRSTCARNDPSSPTSPSPANWPAGAGRWPSST